MCWHVSSCICLHNVKGEYKKLNWNTYATYWAEAAHVILISTIPRWLWSWLPGMTTQGATWEAQLCRGLRYVKLDDPQMSDLNIEDIYVWKAYRILQTISWVDFGKWKCGTMYWIVVRSSSVTWFSWDGLLNSSQDLALEPLLGFSLPVLCDVPGLKGRCKLAELDQFKSEFACFCILHVWKTLFCQNTSRVDSQQHLENSAYFLTLDVTWSFSLQSARCCGG